jgi:hypothetical protein
LNAAAVAAADDDDDDLGGINTSLVTAIDATHSALQNFWPMSTNRKHFLLLGTVTYRRLVG